MKIWRNLLLVVITLILALLGGCSSGEKQKVVGVSFDTLQTEYWVESFEVLKAALEEDGYKMVSAISDNDANRQLSQIKNFLVRGVDGIIVAPKDKQSIIPAIKAANEAGVPIVLYNRPPAESDTQSVTVVADNFQIARETVAYMVEQARESGGTYKAAILIGDLGDVNAIDRREGFNAALAGTEDIIEVVARIPTEWKNEKARAGLVNALQANPDINFLFTSSDLHLPAIVSALKAQDKYHPFGTDGHVILGGLDGDATAYRMILEGYLDATGVQNLYFEAESSLEALEKMWAGETVSERILDPGFVIHRDNLEAVSGQTWGAAVYKRSQQQD